MHTYSDVVNAGLILPYKRKYTMRDVNKLIVDSLFKPLTVNSEGAVNTLSPRQAAFIVACSAMYHSSSVTDVVWDVQDFGPYVIQ